MEGINPRASLAVGNSTILVEIRAKVILKSMRLKVMMVSGIGVHEVCFSVRRRMQICVREWKERGCVKYKIFGLGKCPGAHRLVI